MWTSTERIGDLIISGLLLLIGLVCVVLSKAMPPGEFSVPGPGFFPTLLGILISIVSLALGIQSFFYKEAIQEVRVGNRHIWFTIVAIFVLAIFFERLGFILVITLFILFFLKTLSNLKWIICCLFAIAAAISAYAFFNFLLGVRLPSGSWF
jgi:hypothetical protein